MQQIEGRPDITYPCRVPLKVIGREGELDPERVAQLIETHLGRQAEADQGFTANRKGAYIAYTFWATLPDDQAERPLREAIQALPGYILQM